MPKISIIVCTFNRAQKLGDFLNRLESHVLKSNLDVEIILIDNNSSDETPKILAEYKASSKLTVITVYEIRQGANYARNAGIKNARSQILVFTDDDVDFTDTWLVDFSNYLEKHPECQVITGKIIPKFTLPKPEWLIDRMLNVYGQQNYGESSIDIQFPDFPVEMNKAIRMHIFDLYGGFSTEYSRDDKSLMSNDGKFFFYRLSQNKEIVRYIPGACLFHIIPEIRITPTWVIRRYFWQGVSDIAFQHLVSRQHKLKELIDSLSDFIKLLNQLRNGHISPRRILWHWHGLPVSSKAWHAYQWGVVSRKLGLK